MKHIFVALGQHHLQNFENLIDNNLITEGDRILLASSDIIFDSSKWTKVIISDQSFNNKADSAFNQVAAINSKISSYRKMLNQLSSYKNDAVTVYVSYIEDVLSNFLFLSFGKNTRAVIVEDGTLNYYDHSLKNISRLKFLLKQTIAQTHGIPFKKYKGHSSGAEYGHVNTQFLTLPKFAFIQKNAKQLPLEKEVLPKLTNSLYIIGQESYGTLLGQNYFEQELDNFLKKLKKEPFYQKIDTVYYKPHRNGKQLLESYFETIFSDKKVIVIQSEKTSEVIFFEKLYSKYIAAFDSSTMINVYSKLHDSDRQNVEFYVNPLKNDELVPIFKNLGFQFLNQNKQ